MAKQLNVGNVINLVELINAFNDNVWKQLVASAGLPADSVYSNDNYGEVLSDDSYTGVDGSHHTIKSVGIPQLPWTAWVGVNTTSHNRQITVKNALPPNHLRTLRGKGRQFYTLKWQDVASKVSGDVIDADDVYKAMYTVLHRLITIRPIYTTWQHDAGGTAAGNAFTNSITYYGVYKRSDLEDSSALDSIDYSQHDVSGVSGSYYKWDGYAKGANFSIFSALDSTLPDSQKRQAVSRNNCIEGVALLASNINKEVSTFFQAWSDKCLNRNRFTYRYHTCHINCHSSCWCYSSRGRR